MPKKTHEDEEYNPRLRWAIMSVVSNQIRSGDPPETKATLQRLMSEGWSRENARKLIGQVVAVELFCISKEKKPFNRERFVRNLKNLPSRPVERP